MLSVRFLTLSILGEQMNRGLSAHLRRWVLLVVAVVSVASACSPVSAAPPAQTGQTLVFPIVALAQPPTTTYTAEFANPQGKELQFLWSGPDCGETSEDEEASSDTSGRSSFSWTHPHPPCDPTLEHDHVTITLQVSFDTGTITCTYKGASTGEGPPCTLTEETPSSAPEETPVSSVPEETPVSTITPCETTLTGVFEPSQGGMARRLLVHRQAHQAAHAG